MKELAPWELPFFTSGHDEVLEAMRRWRAAFPALQAHIATMPLDAQCRAVLQALGDAGLLRYAVAGNGGEGGGEGSSGVIDVRSACLVREALAYDSVLADFVFAMQGIGSAAIWLFGSDELRRRYLPGIRDGSRCAAFAMSEPDGSSDVAGLSTRARIDGDDYVIDGAKAWISNGGIADQYIVIARTEDVQGGGGLSAIVVDGDTPGLVIESRTEIISPHPIATIRFTGCRVPRTQLIGEAGRGFKMAMATLDFFRASVGAAATGVARRALDETLQRVAGRQLFGTPMAEMDTVRMKIADMALELDTAALLTYRAAWLKDTSRRSATREIAMAKLGATEAAQRVVDAAVQLFGGTGVSQGSIIEQLYRDIRPMRIYEGASEVQKLIIGKRTLAAGVAVVGP
ncbi:acyl-CoA dehydrogenase family protein [Xylophilus sp. GOD-11R]|uniref:acyl-CoA dehydrogenase family protein n=1 Tax=Xylophilus sp. GOD-11R TaxID=3089814 RepID=UPI00298C8A0B|nr:acyl-CoA dehydrogenase family protein [Xylophilus sp. GOD-11R]WPB58377.1 acyl-CoA dehydrogenase family protein [Xylophilus sp. GOD-11R]